MFWIILACRHTAPAEAFAQRVSVQLTVDEDVPLGRQAELDVCFPTAAPAPWTFQGARWRDNPAGMDVNWGYGAADGTVATVYAYAHHDEASEAGLPLARAEAEASASYVQRATWTHAGEVQLALFGTSGWVVAGTQDKLVAEMVAPELHPMLAERLGVASLDGVSRTVGVLVLVGALPEGFVKYRVTWLDTAVPFTDQLGALVAWSALPCASLRGAELVPPMVDVGRGGLAIPGGR